MRSKNLEVTAQAMALTRARTASGTGTGKGTLTGRGTANMHQICFAEGCGGGDPPRPCSTLRSSSHVPRLTPQSTSAPGAGAWHVQGPSQLHQLDWVEKSPHSTANIQVHRAAQISSLGLGGMPIPDCLQISSFLECSWVDLHPLPFPATSSSPCSVPPSVDSAGSLMTLIIQLFSGHT